MFLLVLPPLLLLLAPVRSLPPLILLLLWTGAVREDEEESIPPSAWRMEELEGAFLFWLSLLQELSSGAPLSATFLIEKFLEAAEEAAAEEGEAKAERTMPSC